MVMKTKMADISPVSRVRTRRNNRELKQRTFFHDGGLHSVRGMIENGVCGAKFFNLSVCSFFTTDAYSVVLSALKRKTGKAVGNVFV